MPSLFIYPPKKGEESTFPLEKDKVSIGRSEDNDIPIHDPFSSGKHVFILRSGKKYILKDNNSKNGTYLNGKKIQGEVELKKPSTGLLLSGSYRGSVIMHDIGVSKPLIGKHKIFVDGSRFKYKKEGNVWVAEPYKSSNFGKKALSTGLIASMLWLYAGRGNLFGKEDDKAKETYEKVLVQTLPKPNIDINEVYNNLINLESRLEDSYQKVGNQGFRYDLKTNKLIPVKEYNQENNSKEDKESEKPEKKKSNFGTIALIAAAVIGGGAALYFLTKKKNDNNGPPPDKPDLTVICCDLNGNRVNNAAVVIDGNTYNATNGEYTLKDITKGNHSVDFTGNVLDTWLIVMSQTILCREVGYYVSKSTFFYLRRRI